MTVEQCTMFLEYQATAREEKFKEQAVLLDCLANQIVSGVAGLLGGKNKMITLDKLYPTLFGKKTQQEVGSTKSQKQIWTKFLFS